MSDYSMWRYWRDDKGYLNAVEDYYPEALNENAEIANAVAMIKNGQRALNSIFEELADAEDDEDEI